jgi:hypothetical protein
MRVRTGDVLHLLSFPGYENRKHDGNEHTQGNSDRCYGDAGDREQTFDEGGLDGKEPEYTCGRYRSFVRPIITVIYVNAPRRRTQIPSMIVDAPRGRAYTWSRLAAPF